MRAIAPQQRRNALQSALLVPLVAMQLVLLGHNTEMGSASRVAAQDFSRTQGRTALQDFDTTYRYPSGYNWHGNYLPQFFTNEYYNDIHNRWYNDRYYDSNHYFDDFYHRDYAAHRRFGRNPAALRTPGYSRAGYEYGYGPYEFPQDAYARDTSPRDVTPQLLSPQQSGTSPNPTDSYYTSDWWNNRNSFYNWYDGVELNL
jgi:hypothetical protein